jgi:acetylornithine deacetylase/succinyl-diaminopimelate desuccinylase-like protein
VSISALLERCRSVDPEPIAELATRMLEVWSPPGQEAEMAALAHRALVDAGAEDVTIDDEFPASPSVIAWLRSGRPGRTIQWHGHLDAIKTPQGPVRREGDLIYGRGASDMKGALAAEVEAVKLLRELGFPEQGNVLITFHGLHEEGRSAPLHRLIERGVHGDAVIIGELGSPTELVTNSRGLTFWDLIVSRPGGSVHEQNAPAGTVHPIRAGRLLLDRLIDLADSLAAGRELPRGSLFVGKFNSGDYYNRVPASAEIGGSRRHHADSTLEVVRDQLIRLAKDVGRETGATIEPRIFSLTEAYEISAEERIARALRLANSEVTGQVMAPVASRATGNAADFVREAGSPAVYYGCDYATAHSDVELLNVADLSRVASVFALATAYYLDERTEIDAPALAQPPAPAP